MKKTQSLKLMLVGLLCSMGMNAWAQYTASNGVVYKVEGDNATAVAISATAIDASGEKAYILIADKVGSATVKGIAADWLNPADADNFYNQSGQIVVGTETTPGAASNVTVETPSGQVTVEKFNIITAEQLKDKKIKFEYEASEIKTIEREKIEALIPMIYHFGLYKKSGITVIPEYLFAVKKLVTSAAGAAAAEQAAIDKAEAEQAIETAQTNKEAIEAEKAVPEANKAVFEEKKAAADDAIQKALDSDAYYQASLIKSAADAAYTEAQAMKNKYSGLESVWNQATSDVRTAVENPTDANINALDDDEKAVYDNIVQECAAAHVSVNGQGGYTIPDFLAINDMVKNTKKAAADAQNLVDAVLFDIKGTPDHSYVYATKSDGQLTPASQLDAENIEDLEDFLEYVGEGYVFNPENWVNPTEGLYTLAGLQKISDDLQAAIDGQQAIIDEIDGRAQAQQDIIDQKTEDIEGYDDLINNPEQEYALNGNNEVLERVWYSSNIKTTEQYAFANCVKATFTFAGNDQLPAVTEKIEKAAFQNTLFSVLDMSLTNTLDRNDDKKIDRIDRLTDTAIADDAFAGTPMVTMDLTNSALTFNKAKTIAQSLKKEEPIELEFCNLAEPEEFTNMNTTLTTVNLTDLGEEYVELSDEATYARIPNEAFYKCWGLTTVVIPTYLTQIGNSAFELTNVPAFDFTGYKKLAQTGRLSFAFNPSLTTVTFDPEAPLTKINGSLFRGSCNLATVVFNKNLEEISAHAFGTNKLAELNLCDTKVTVLNNLFDACPETEIYKSTSYSQSRQATSTGYDERLGVNETLTSVCLPEGLEEIDAFAFASCWGLTEVDIPGNVDEMGDAVFYNAKYLKTVTIMDSKLCGLPPMTFKQCSNLETVYFVTLETISCGFGDNCFQSAGTATTKPGQRPDVYVGFDSYTTLSGSTVVFPSTFANLLPYQPVITLNDIAGMYMKPYTSKYGTWIEATEKTGVFSAYQDGEVVLLYPAKKSSYKNPITGEIKQYYKIAAFDKDKAFAAMREDGTSSLVPREIEKLVKARLSFGSEAATLNGVTLPTEILAKAWMAAGTAVIISTEEEITYLQKTNPDQKYQSTVDLGNQLWVAEKDIKADNNTNFYYLAEVTDEDGVAQQGWVHHNDKEFLEIIPEGAVCFMKTAPNGQGARDFMNIVIVSENEATAIGGVTEYVSAKNGDVIYNLQGVKVLVPVKGQMYIQGGKKFIQK